MTVAAVVNLSAAAARGGDGAAGSPDAAPDVAGDASGSARVIRGPYLQLGSPTGVTVRWRTNVPTDSVVRYGATIGALGSMASNPALTSEHIVPLAGLAAATRYHYAVGSSAGIMTGDDAQTYFVTPPAIGTAAKTHVWVLGDSGFVTPALIGVRDSYRTLAAGRYTDVLLLLGDNAYNSGTDAEFQTNLFDAHAQLLRRTFVWPTIGNHDAALSALLPDDIAYFQIFSLPTKREVGGVASGTEKYYSFDQANIHFVCLDSMISSRATDGAMVTWLEADLTANTSDWVIAYFHHPVYSKGSHDSDFAIEQVEMRENVVPVLEQLGVDLVLAGHTHAYERSYLLAGHYGKSNTLTPAMRKNAGTGRPAESGAYGKPMGPGRSQEGTVYVVAGSSAWVSGGPLNHPAMLVSLNRNGSLVLDIDGPRLDARFVRENGRIDDTFSIVKGQPAQPDNAAPTVTLAADKPFTVWPATFVLTATAEDSDGTIARVEFVVGGEILGTTTVAPHQYTWTGLPTGAFTVNARAFDDRGASTLSNAITVAVTEPVIPPEPPEVVDAAVDAAVDATEDAAMDATEVAVDVEQDGPKDAPVDATQDDPADLAVDVAPDLTAAIDAPAAPADAAQVIDPRAADAAPGTSEDGDAASDASTVGVDVGGCDCRFGGHDRDRGHVVALCLGVALVGAARRARRG